MISDFVHYLSHYYSRENDLSNITKIMCDSSRFFKNYFIHFFFPHLDVEEVMEIRREHRDTNDGGSRVDFFLELNNDDKPYLIEVKIYDTNHHFGQYEHSYDIPSERLGYITNYSMKQDGYDVKTWEEFYDYLNQINKANQEDKELVDGYLKYLQSVCSIIKFNKPMKLQYLFSLFEFFKILPKLLTRTNDSFEMTPGRIYDSRLKSGISVIDLNFKPLTFEFNHSFYGQFDIYFEREQPLITFFVQDCKEYKSEMSKIIENISSLQGGRLFEKPYKEPDDWGNDGIWFDMRPEVFSEIQEMDSIDKQIKMMGDFIDEAVIYFLKQFEESIVS